MSQGPAIIVMAKWPAAGVVKTRLVPPLSASEAADLYTAMLRDVLAAGAALDGVRLVVGHFPAKDQAAFHKLAAECGGEKAILIPQEGPDLASRMQHCFDEVFALGYAPVLMRNSDAPTFPARIIKEALAKLSAGAQAVFSPDASSGFGLIGLARPVHGLLSEPLLTENSYEEILARCVRQGIHAEQVEPWYDVDTAADLARLLDEWKCGETGPAVTAHLNEKERGDSWAAQFGGASGEQISKEEHGGLKISVIIPTKNEEANIAPLVESLAACGAGEIIVADGYSEDSTAETARRAGARVIQSRGGVVAQLNEAALEASGNVFLFLHADTRLEGDPFGPIRKALESRQVVAGGFTLDYGEKLRWRALSWGANRRARMMGLPMGDQGIFIRSEIFGSLQGFRKGPLLPDLDLVIRARHHGRIALLSEKIFSSPRRYEENGLVRNWLSNQLLFFTQVFSAEQAPQWAHRMLESLRGKENKKKA